MLINFYFIAIIKKEKNGGGSVLYYKIDVINALKEKGYTTYRIRQEKIIGEGQMTKLRKGEIAGKETLNKLCAILDLQPGDILGYRADE